MACTSYTGPRDAEKSADGVFGDQIIDYVMLRAFDMFISRSTAFIDEFIRKNNPPTVMPAQQLTNANSNATNLSNTEQTIFIRDQDENPLLRLKLSLQDNLTMCRSKLSSQEPFAFLDQNKNLVREASESTVSINKILTKSGNNFEVIVKKGVKTNEDDFLLVNSQNKPVCRVRANADTLAQLRAIIEKKFPERSQCVFVDTDGFEVAENDECSISIHEIETKNENGKHFIKIK